MNKVPLNPISLSWHSFWSPHPMLFSWWLRGCSPDRTSCRCGLRQLALNSVSRAMWYLLILVPVTPPHTYGVTIETAEEKRFRWGGEGGSHFRKAFWQGGFEWIVSRHFLEKFWIYRKVEKEVHRHKMPLSHQLTWFWVWVLGLTTRLKQCLFSIFIV